MAARRRGDNIIYAHLGLDDVDNPRLLLPCKPEQGGENMIPLSRPRFYRPPARIADAIYGLGRAKSAITNSTKDEDLIAILEELLPILDQAPDEKPLVQVLLISFKVESKRDAALATVEKILELIGERYFSGPSI